MDRYYWYALKSVPYVGNVLFRRLVERFGSPESVFAASGKDLAAVPGVGARAVESIRTFDCRAPALREVAAVKAGRVRVVTFLDDDYPFLLKKTDDAPPFLYVRGNLGSIEPAVAVVGSRRATSYGRMITEKLAEGLASAGIAVISGLARGVDTAAHRGALKVGGKTIGVLGCGVDVIYPPENRELSLEMAEHGALVSEFPMGTQPLAENFPRRNRIISGMSWGVLVVEAAENSGSLITAQLALEQGREVFAVPGNISSATSRGANQLIKQGAKLVDDVGDILAELPQWAGKRQSRPEAGRPDLSPQEAAVYDALDGSPLHIDDIIAKCGLTVGEVSAILLRLELKGAVTQLPGMFFSM